LLNIATNFASGEEAVGAIFFDGSAKGKKKSRGHHGLRLPRPHKEKEGLQGEAVPAR